MYHTVYASQCIYYYYHTTNTTNTNTTIILIILLHILLPLSYHYTHIRLSVAAKANKSYADLSCGVDCIDSPKTGVGFRRR
jgi:hypothetical protein